MGNCQDRGCCIECKGRERLKARIGAAASLGWIFRCVRGESTGHTQSSDKAICQEC